MSKVKALKPDAKTMLNRVVNRGSGRGEVYLYGDVGASWFGEGVTAKDFADAIKGLGKVNTIDLRINSEGGDVFAGKAMYSLLVEHQAKVITHIDGLAASAASYVAMAGDEIEIAEAAFLMIHNPYTIVRGGSDDLRRQADLLDTVADSIRKVYVDRTGADDEQIKAWMEDETWFSGADAVEHGFADRTVENLKVAASISNSDKFKNLPKALMPRRSAALARLKALNA